MRRSIAVKGVRFSVEVPEHMAPPALRRAVKRVVHMVRPPALRRPTGGARLDFAEVPPVAYEPRDLDLALAFLVDDVDRGQLAPWVDTGTDPDARRLANEVAGYPWYHTIELPFGIVTPGAYDHRPVVERYGIPDDLEGKRVLDVATNDGFWAFEFERRGAKVTALDIDATDDLDLPLQVARAAAQRGLSRPIGEGFALAHRALKSSVERVSGSVYELDPEKVGRFDLVHSGDLLLHLRDPCRALERIWSVTAGQALLAEPFDPQLGTQERRLVRYLGARAMVGWWQPALDTLVQMVVDAGFSSVEVVTVYRLMVLGQSDGPWRAVLRARP